MFNEESRKSNIIRIATTVGISNIINISMQFIYRTVFLRILSKEYLGIEGLFTNIIQVVSLAELGIGTLIAYRLYEPIKNNNVKKISSIIFFYKNIYRFIAFVIIIFGTLCIPFLKYLIKNSSEIPSNENIIVLYVLFLLQSVCSYFSAYKQILLSADQKENKLCIYVLIGNLIKTMVQMVILIFIKSYALTLLSAIILTIFWNFFVGRKIEKQYYQVFINEEKISKEEKKIIFKDMKAIMCHKIGGTVLGSTDNIIISSFIGLGELGKYSNYSLIIGAIQKFIGQVLGNFTASIGNAHFTLQKNQKEEMYSKLLFLNLWIVNVVSTCLYSFLNIFINIWQGSNMLLQESTVFVLILSFYINLARQTNICFINGCGLFGKDMYRPIIEATINLFISIYLAKKLGITGIFLGTIGSHLATVFWREPYLLYKYEFKSSVSKYWKLYIKMFCCFLMMLYFQIYIKNNFSSIYLDLIITLLCFVLNNVILFLFNFKNDEFIYFVKEIANQISKRKKNNRFIFWRK